MEKIINIHLPHCLWSKIDSLGNKNRLEFDKDVRLLIEENYKHLLDVSRSGYFFDFKYCKNNKSLMLRIADKPLNSSPKYFMEL